MNAIVEAVIDQLTLRAIDFEIVRKRPTYLDFKCPIDGHREHRAEGGEPDAENERTTFSCAAGSKTLEILTALGIELPVTAEERVELPIASEHATSGSDIAVPSREGSTDARSSDAVGGLSGREPTGKPPRSLDEYKALIESELADITEGIVATGRLLIEARQEHPRSFVRWLESGSAGFSRSSAYRLIDIAESDLASFPTLGNFPHDSGALVELARLKTPQLTAAIEAGEINPRLSRKGAKALVERFRPTTAQRDKLTPSAPTRTGEGKGQSQSPTEPIGYGTSWSVSAARACIQDNAVTIQASHKEAEVVHACLLNARSQAQRTLSAEDWDAFLNFTSRLGNIVGELTLIQNSTPSVTQ
jgi:hypothetical protein